MIHRYDSPVNLNDQDLDRVLGFHLPVMLFFWQDFRHLAPVNDELLRIAREKAGKLIIAKINALKNTDGSRIFNVEDTPLLFGLKDGAEMPRFVVNQHEFVRSYASFLLDEGPLPDQPAKTENGYSFKTPAKPIEITDASFEQQVLFSELPVLVDFWASWCMPCQVISPLIRQITREFEGLLRVVKIDVDENPYYAGLYGVQSIPTLLLFQNGSVVEHLSGITSSGSLRSLIQKRLTLS